MSHFYDHQGNPVYQVQMTSKGREKETRDTTLRDARKLNLVPSVTTVTGILDKQGLKKYFAEHTIFAVMSQDRQKLGEEWDDYVKRIMYEADRHSKEAARRGGELHDTLEVYFKTGLLEKDQDFLLPVIDEIHAKFGKTRKWISEMSFAHDYGYGGKLDLISEDGQYIIDFKTKTTDDIKKFYTYDEHMMQLSAYRTGTHNPGAKCFDLYFSTKKPKVLKLHEWTEEQLQEGFDMFSALLSYWKIANKYNSRFKLTEAIK